MHWSVMLLPYTRSELSGWAPSTMLLSIITATTWSEPSEICSKMTRKRLMALHFDHHMVEDVSELVNLHLRFHGYVEEPWTDSAVRRYVKDAGPLYERLNRLTRADTTTQNKRKAMMFSAAMDEMEQRVRDLKEKEDFDAIRPDLNGDEIMQLLSIEPGPMVGKAYKHMLEYRLDNGPVERDVAVAELERWYKEQGE